MVNASENLPINSIKEALLNAIEQQSSVILSAPPGAGKSTMLPLWLLQNSTYRSQKIIMLQPRRIAAKSVAIRLAEQLGESVGNTVGYRMRNDTKVSQNTRLEVVTEGILTRMIQQDNELSDVGLIIFDEFHERSIHADLAFALTLDVQQGLRDDLKILLMSATIDNQYLQSFLPDAISLSCEGRSFAVEIDYQSPKLDREWRNHALSVVKHQTKVQQGSILVFLPGISDIKFLYNNLIEQLPNDVDVYPLFGNLTIKEQQQAIAPSVQGRRKIVLATNIAETSLTIDGITMVIDSGLEKVAQFDNDSLINQLKLQKTSKASSIQRSGRAGRIQPGQCIRLYSQEDYSRRQEHSESEIKQADLLPLTMEVARWGVTSFKQLNFLELPSSIDEQRNWHLLKTLDAIGDNNSLTDHGISLSTFSCHPRFAHMLLNAIHLFQQNKVDKQLLCVACLMAALLEERDINRYQSDYSNVDLTHRLHQLVTALTTNRSKNPLINRILQQAEQLARQVKSVLGIPYSLSLTEASWPLDMVGVLLAYAYPERIAKLANNGNYLCANGKGALLKDDDKLFLSEFLVCSSLHSYQQKLHIQMAAFISVEQINEYFAKHITEKNVLLFDDRKQRIISEQQTCLQSIVLTRKPATANLTAEALTSLWCDYIRKKGLQVVNYNLATEKLLTRLRWLNSFVDEIALDDFSESNLLASLEYWLAPYLNNVKTLNQLRALNFHDILFNSLDYSIQQSISVLAPKHYVSPTGRSFDYIYGCDPQPKLSLPMQQVYGLSDSPSVANGAIKALLELLSPAGRPIQITQDLARFWQGSYKEVQKDMRSRYPKHYWPDNPASAVATNKTKKNMDHER
ncbi:ATP-dependent helicase HrpB [Thalassotalea crassostreae]|uniref:ATP-dependent helicase HrpB n=1 Tax=Thalassotalea crassostreae TaxID=1763536 RepID=UPI000837E653|nr:ATP-dependent helicase HrpB [Thalassotalea crassostreae]